ncbi:MAG: phospholipase [Bacteroidetes bacterium]|nr:phospholipase [Bacteroidota bacterium]MBS1973377.1 phospholipase [Bacteroidota bacterium]
MPSKKKIRHQQYTTVNRVRLIRSGKQYFDELLQLINKAKESVHIQTYIYNDDETGRMIAEALKKAVQRNVVVHLLADGYASQSLSGAFIADLKKSGVQFRFFAPIFKSKYFYFGRRLHHKVAVADAKFALVGGINIADKYNDLPGKPAWLDFALFAEGEIAAPLCVLCWKTWNGYPLKMELTPCEKQKLLFDIPEPERNEVKMCRNDWVRRKNEISKTYVTMLRNAHTQVIMLCSYFLPGKIIRKQMVQAIKRGVKIRVIAAGRSDVMLAKMAERWLYAWLLRNGVELYEYQENILHGKIAACDDRWVTLGSYNINDISAYASIELNLDVRNNTFAQQVRETLETIIDENCIPVVPGQHNGVKNIFSQFMQWLSYKLFKVIFYLFTFYFRHQR